jgi:hypothetical protein
VHLDTRRGVERRDAPAVTLPVELHRPLLTAARTLGLLGTQQPSAHCYDAIVILGGATTGNALRAELAAEVASTTHGWELVGLTSHRQISDSEHATDPDSIEDQTEWRNLSRQIARYFGPLTPTPPSQDDEEEQLFTTNDGKRLLLMIAGVLDHRVNTADQIKFLCQRRTPALRRSVLLVTNAIYAPYQFFTAAPLMLRSGTSRVELIGTDTSTSEPHPRLYQRLAQEIHSGIGAALKILGGNPV